MKKENLLRQIADTAYNVGFGAKKHFATYDIVDKVPGVIAFVSMAVGIYGLVYDAFSEKGLSAFILVLGVLSLYIERYGEDKDKFMNKGEELTRIFNSLKVLYFKVNSSQKNSFEEEQKELDEITSLYYSNSLSTQILFSDWFAHYKFFWQHQIGWIDEQKHFKFWRDKVPLSFTLFLVLILLVVLEILFWKCV